MDTGSLGRPSSRRAPAAACLLALTALAVAVQGAAGQGEGAVAGVVVDARTLRPLVGAQVLIAGTERGTLTDAGGRFRIAGLGGGQVLLEVQMLGYRSQQRAVPVGATDLHFALAEMAIALDEIVVTGTPGGTQRRAVGNSVAAVEAAELQEVAPVSSVQQLLGSRVPGVVVMQGSGNLGTGAVTRVRGLSTLALTNEPIVYVDGVRVDNNPRAGPSIRGGRQVSRLNDLAPEEIERIEVIRGPAAATLYGTEASNGVIQIFTKRGVTGRPSFELVTRQGANWLPDPQARFPTLWGRDPATGQLVSVNLLAEERAAGRRVFQNGPVQSYALSVRGGGEAVRYFVAGELSREEGMVDYNWEKRWNVRTNLDVVASDRLDFSVNLGLLQNTIRLAQAATGWDLVAQLVWGSPTRKSGPTRGYLRAPPEAVATIESLTGVDRVVFSGQAQHRPLPWLAQRVTLGLDVGNETSSILFPRHPLGSAYFFGGQSLGEKTLERRRTVLRTLDYSLTASLDVAPEWSLATSVGAQHYARQVEVSSAQGRIFPAPGVETVGGAAVTTGSEDFLENKTLGLYLQEQIGWKNRRFLTLAVRGDDNSAFGENFDAALYPKLAASWILHEEPFWRWEAVNTLKLRAAWGRAGQQPDVFAAARLFAPTTGPGDAATVSPQNIGNPDLKPEVGEELELGLDAALFQDRLSVGVTYYDQRTRDAIVERPVPPSGGFPGTQFVNVGELRNRGWEIALGVRPLERRWLTADVNATLATNESEVVSLGGLPPIVLGRQRHQEGYPVAAFFHRVVVSSRILPDGRVTDVMCRGGEAPDAPPVPCAQAPAIYRGRADPAWSGSASLALTFRESLRLYARVEYQGGYFIENGDIGAAHALIRNTRAIHEGRDPILMGYAQLGDWQTVGFMDAGFAKLREVSATYTLPSAWTRRFGLDRASVTVAGRNLATVWQATKEIYGVRVADPEIRQTSSEDSGYVQTVMPQMAQLVTTLRLTF